MRHAFGNALGVLAVAVLLGLAAAPGRGGRDGLKEELATVRKERAQLEQKLEAVKEREGLLERGIEARDQGSYARLEVKGRLGKRVIPSSGLFGAEAVVWTVTAGENTYELFVGNSPSAAAFLALAERRVGKAVLASGELAAPRHPTPQLLEVRTFTAVKD